MSVNTIVVSTRSASEPPRTPVMNSSISSSICACLADPVDRVRAGQFDITASGDVLGEISAVLHRDERRIGAMQDQRRRGDERQLSRTSPSTSTWLDLRAMLGDAARFPAMSHHVRNAPSPATDGATAQNIEARSTASGSSATVMYGLAPARTGAGWVVGRPQGTGGAVDDHQVGHPLGVAGGQQDRTHRGESRPEYRRAARTRPHPSPSTRPRPRHDGRDRCPRRCATTYPCHGDRTGSPWQNDGRRR